MLISDAGRRTLECSSFPAQTRGDIVMKISRIIPLHYNFWRAARSRPPHRFARPSVNRWTLTLKPWKETPGIRKRGKPTTRRYIEYSMRGSEQNTTVPVGDHGSSGLDTWDDTSER
ncbi:hypothetical protein EVAR_74342_1 [Eumeta japonica]|uniref:Uncharacterized protein n=1 Tax=Eumeta variegata TaxID=151549 RepID=A0A4C1SFW4_EUMVA|nr:hypothetical protein EVAR_74342_1 [Eumeta japonica]